MITDRSGKLVSVHKDKTKIIAVSDALQTANTGEVFRVSKYDERMNMSQFVEDAVKFWGEVNIVSN